MPSFVTLSTTQIKISPTLCSQVATHTFKIIVSETNKQSDYTISIKVQNRPPEYVPTTFIYPPMTIALNSVGTQTIQSYKDPDSISAISSISTTTGLPISLASEVITIAPVACSLVGFHTVVVTITDACGDFITRNLDVTVTNTAPYFLIANSPDIEVPMNSVFTMTTKEFNDNEGHFISMSLYNYSSLTGPLLTTAPTFATIVPLSSYKI